MILDEMIGGELVGVDCNRGNHFVFLRIENKVGDEPRGITATLSAYQARCLIGRLKCVIWESEHDSKSKVVNMKSVYGVYVNTDLTEGRGNEVLIGLFTQREDAAHFAKGKGVMGSDARVTAIDLYSSYEDWWKAESARLRSSALARLSVEEKKALGLEGLE